MPNPNGSPTPAEIDDFVARNGGATGGGGGRGDRGRAVEALTNNTSGRDFDSQGPMYHQRTNSLSAAGQTATMALQQRRRAMPMGLYGLASTGQAPMRGGGFHLPTLPASRMPLPFSVDSGLPPGVPPGSVPVNAGINPDAWAYQTPDGRIVRGSRGNNRLEQMSGLSQLAAPRGRL